jgi:hypothetical protein
LISQGHDIMLIRTRLSILLLASLFMFGCAAPLVSQYSSLGSDLANRVVSPDKSKLMVYNSTNKILYALNHQVDIWLNDAAVGSLDSGQYLQVEVPRGIHKLKLRHIDVVPFVSEHELKVEGDSVILEVWSTLVSNSMRTHAAVPGDAPQPLTPAPRK